MKAITLNLVLVFGAVFMGLTAEAKNDRHIEQIIQDYLNIKNALVKSDPKAAAESGKALIKIFYAIDKTAYDRVLINDIINDAEKIASVKDLGKQRDYFASLSKSIYRLIISAKPQGLTIYQFHCPMKDTYWLSDERAVKNPYYGNQMLNCGKLTETIKF